MRTPYEPTQAYPTKTKNSRVPSFGKWWKALTADQNAYACEIAMAIAGQWLGEPTPMGLQAGWSASSVGTPNRKANEARGVWAPPKQKTILVQSVH